MKTAEANFRFPVLGFTPDLNFWGFADLNTLTSVGRRTVRDKLQIGMELIDADGRRWVVRSVRRTGRAEPLLNWLVAHLISAPQSRIEHELDELEAVSIEEVRERARVSLEATSSDYCADDEREQILEPLLARLRSAKSTGEILDLLGLDSFMAY